MQHISAGILRSHWGCQIPWMELELDMGVNFCSSAKVVCWAISIGPESGSCQPPVLSAPTGYQHWVLLDKQIIFIGDREMQMYFGPQRNLKLRSSLHCFLVFRVLLGAVITDIYLSSSSFPLRLALRAMQGFHFTEAGLWQILFRPPSTLFLFLLI